MAGKKLGEKRFRGLFHGFDRIAVEQAAHYGCAEYNFGKTASELTRSECALIAATLPNPRKFSSKYPSAYMRKRQSRIKHEMRYIPSFPKEGEDYNPQTSSGGIYSTK